MHKTVKCKDCGFFTFRDAATRLLVEVDESTRDSGNFPRGREGKNRFQPDPLWEPIPLCFKMRFALNDELRRIEAVVVDPPRRREEAIFIVIDTERECDVFEPWRRGFTPKELHEMLDRRTMLWMQIAVPIISAIVGGLIAILALGVQKPPVVNNFNYIQAPVPPSVPPPAVSEEHPK